MLSKMVNNQKCVNVCFDASCPMQVLKFHYRFKPIAKLEWHMKCMLYALLTMLFSQDKQWSLLSEYVWQIISSNSSSKHECCLIGKYVILFEIYYAKYRKTHRFMATVLHKMNTAYLTHMLSLHQRPKLPPIDKLFNLLKVSLSYLPYSPCFWRSFCSIQYIYLLQAHPSTISWDIKSIPFFCGKF